eukprot:8085794-Pyramimonas_sp.AAC.1
MPEIIFSKGSRTVDDNLHARQSSIHHEPLDECTLYGQRRVRIPKPAHAVKRRCDCIQSLVQLGAWGVSRGL